MKHVLRSFSQILIPVLLFHFFSCTVPREYVYLNDIENLRDTLMGPIKPFREQQIMPDDLLSIQVSALNPEDVQMFNITGLGTQTMSSSQFNPQTLGYLVDKQGQVSLPYVGEFDAGGLTLRELEIFLSQKLKKYVKEPVVRVRFLNHTVTILGEVSNPREIPMNYERMTLAEALGNVGDLKTTAYRTNILVVREDKGYRISGRVDLTSKTVFNNPFFYMQNRDMVYVEPVQAAYVNRTDKISKYLGTGTAILSIVLSVVALLRR